MTNLWFLYPNQIFKIHSTFYKNFFQIDCLSLFIILNCPYSFKIDNLTPIHHLTLWQRIVTGWDGNVENKIPPFYTQVCGLLTGERNASLGALEDYDFEAWQPPTSRRESPSNHRERDRNISARTVIEEIYNFLRKM